MNIFSVDFPKHIIFTIEKFEIENGKGFMNTYKTKRIKIDSYAMLEEAIAKIAAQANVSPSKIDYEIDE